MKTPRKRAPWSHGDRLLMIVLAVVLGGVGLGVWSHGQDRMPDVIVPTPVLPSPNAFDYYVRAGSAITGGGIISPVVQPKTPTPAQAAVVRQNAPAIALLHQGFSYPFHGPPIRSVSSDNFPQYQKMRSLARLLALQARVDAAQGDWNGAMTADLDCLRMGEDTARGSGEIGMLVGAACEAIGRRHAWEAVDHLNVRQARAAARRLEDIRARHVPFADTMQEEKWTEQAVLMELMRRRDWADSSGMGSHTFGDKLSNWKDEATVRLLGKRAILANVTRYLDQRLANARQPYAAHPPEPTPAADPVSQMLFSSSTEYGADTTEQGFRTNEAKADTQNALLMTLLALRAYKLEHGQYPAALSALAPSYLKAVPDDPFALSGSLRYKRTPNGYLLYSVGPDGKDDGGKPIFDATKSAPTKPGASDERYYVLPNSQGDVVAGVNVF